GRGSGRLFAFGLCWFHFGRRLADRRRLSLKPHRSRSAGGVVDIRSTPPKLDGVFGGGLGMSVHSKKATRRRVMSALGAAALAAPAIRSAHAQAKTIVFGGSVPLSGET